MEKGRSKSVRDWSLITGRGRGLQTGGVQRFLHFPQDGDKCCAPPPLFLFKGWKLFAPLFSIAKTSCSCVKTTSKRFVSPFSMVKTFSTLTPFFRRCKTSLAPPPPCNWWPVPYSKYYSKYKIKQNRPQESYPWLIINYVSTNLWRIFWWGSNVDLDQMLPWSGCHDNMLDTCYEEWVVVDRRGQRRLPSWDRLRWFWRWFSSRVMSREAMTTRARVMYCLFFPGAKGCFRSLKNMYFFFYQQMVKHLLITGVISIFLLHFDLAVKLCNLIP